MEPVSDALGQCELFSGLGEPEVARLRAIVQTKTLRAGEYLFLLGERAEGLYVLTRGQVDLCFPFSFRGHIRDITFESKGQGSLVGWSGLVAPFRFTLSARVVEPAEVAFLPRVELVRIFDEEPKIGYVCLRGLSDVIGHRLLAMQALWARELQRVVTSGLESAAAAKP